jgi:hypothetical protein
MGFPIASDGHRLMDGSLVLTNPNRRSSTAARQLLGLRKADENDSIDGLTVQIFLSEDGLLSPLFHC